MKSHLDENMEILLDAFTRSRLFNKTIKGTNYAFYYSSDMRSVIQHQVDNL